MAYSLTSRTWSTVEEDGEGLYVHAIGRVIHRRAGIERPGTGNASRLEIELQEDHTLILYTIKARNEGGIKWAAIILAAIFGITHPRYPGVIQLGAAG